MIHKYNQSLPKGNLNLSHDVDEQMNMRFTFESFIILVLSIFIVVSNVLTLLVLFKTEMLNFLNRYFFVSFTASDLAIGLLVTPFSFWASIFDEWIYGTYFCHITSYVAAILWIANIYSLMWLSIDNYVAIRKPDRYDNLMTPMRCLCWVAFIWLAAFSFCCPPLFGSSRAEFYHEAFICIIDWDLQKAYFITSGLLILIPPLIALTIANLYMFTHEYQDRKSVYQKCTDSNSRPKYYIIVFVIGLMTLFSWLPWCTLQLYELYQPAAMNNHHTAPAQNTTAPSSVHFYLLWLALSNSAWKFLVYVIVDHDFRVGLKQLYAKLACFKMAGMVMV